MLMQALLYLVYQWISWLNTIQIPVDLWVIHGRGYAGLSFVAGYMARLPFVPWDAVAVVVTALIAFWLIMYVATVVIRLIFWKWGNGSGAS